MFIFLSDEDFAISNNAILNQFEINPPDTELALYYGHNLQPDLVSIPAVVAEYDETCVTIFSGDIPEFKVSDEFEIQVKHEKSTIDYGALLGDLSKFLNSKFGQE